MAHLVRREFRSPRASVSDLPFVADVKVAPRKSRRNFWHVPTSDDYSVACDLGEQYACEFLQFIKDCPRDRAGLLGWISSAMVKDPVGTARNGYAVGFWSAIDLVLCRAAAREDHWAVVQHRHAYYDKLDALASHEVTTADTIGARHV